MLTGQRVDRYQILEQLGEGGMAVVYKAYDTRLERDVAFKVIRKEAVPADQHTRLMQRFLLEAKALARLMHPHIVAIFDSGDYQGSPYLIQEYIRGGTLKERMKGPVNVQQAVAWLSPIADALGYAHNRSIIHRDVKPANILFNQEGRPMLTDFGISKLLDDEDIQLTKTGLGVGTPEYMAPEQWQGEVLPQSDIYALGVVFYELLTGQKPYTADTPAAIFYQQITEPLRQPSQLNPAIPEAAEKLLYKALAQKPGDRYETMGDFQKALLDLKAGSQQEPIPIASQQNAPQQINLDRQSALITIDGKGDHLAVDRATLKQKKAKIPGWMFIAGGISLFLCGVVVVVGLLLGGAWIFNEEKSQSSLIGSLVSQQKDEDQTPPVFSETPEINFVDIPARTVENTSTLAVTTPTITGTVTLPATMIPTRTATETAEVFFTSGDLQVNAMDNAPMVYIPAGEFLMGSEDAQAYDNEKPQHGVYLDAFWFYQHPVTNAQFGKFVNQTGYLTSAEQRGRSWVFGENTLEVSGAYWAAPEGLGSDVVQRQDHPVVHISWDDAAAYCAWAGGRLPTEAEWEKAARGETGRTYPWGEAAPTCNYANYSGCAGRTVKVGTYPNSASPYGAQDMVGNVWEWVADWYSGSYYSVSSNDNPQGPVEGEVRVIRGASWVSNAKYLRVSNRFSSGMDETSNDHGFRCVIISTP